MSRLPAAAANVANVANIVGIGQPLADWLLS
jgi:hypothetical protein